MRLVKGSMMEKAKLKRQLRQMSVTLENPAYDRRCKSGLKSVAQFSCGQALILSIREGGRYVERFIDMPGAGGVSGILGSDLYEALMAHSQPREPQSWDEAIQLEFHSSGDWLGNDVLKSLIASGRVSIQEALDHARRLDQDLNADVADERVEHAVDRG